LVGRELAFSRDSVASSLALEDVGIGLIVVGGITGIVTTFSAISNLDDAIKKRKQANRYLGNLYFRLEPTYDYRFKAPGAMLTLRF